MKKVLIVDDDIFLTALYEKLLRNEGYEVEVANSGVSGIATISDIRPDLILLDLHMPDMHGTEVLKAVRNDPELQHICVIVFATGYIKSLVNEVADLGVHKVLSKMKCKPRALVAEVKESLENLEQASASPNVQPSTTSLETAAQHLEEVPAIDQKSIWIERLLNDDRDKARQVCLLHLFRMIKADIDRALEFDVNSAEYKLGRALKKLMEDLFEKPKLVTPSTVNSLDQAVEKLLNDTKKRDDEPLDSEAELQELLKGL